MFDVGDLVCYFSVFFIRKVAAKVLVMDSFPFEISSSNVNDIVDLIMLPDGNISDYEDDKEFQDEATIRCETNPQIQVLLDATVSPDNEDSETVDTGESPSSSATPNSSSAAKQITNMTWRKRNCVRSPINRWDDALLQTQLKPTEDVTPAEQFLQMFDDGIFQLIAEQSNIYAHQKDEFILTTSKLEIKRLFGILMQMSIVKMHRWAQVR